MSGLRRRAPVIIAVIAGIAIPAISQAVPPHHVLTHEYSQTFAGIAAALLYFLSAWVGKRVAKDPHFASESAMNQLGMVLGKGVVLGLVMGGISLVFMIAANIFVHHCLLRQGIAFFLVTWLPTAAVACVVGCALGTRGWRWRGITGVLFLVVALCIGHDVAQGLRGLRMVDPLLGELRCFWQRGNMSMTRVHAYQRAVVFALACGLWQLALWRAGRRAAECASERAAARRARTWACLVLGGVAAVAVGAGSRVGIGWGKGAIEDRLSQVRTSEHFVFHYAPAGQSEPRMKSIERSAEWCASYLFDAWGIAPRKPVQAYVFDGGGDVEELTGTCAHASLHTLYLSSWDAANSTLLHEIVHAVHVELQPRPDILLSRGMLEGLAMAYEDGFAEDPATHEELAGALLAGKLPSAEVFMEPGGFTRINESNAYHAAGSFVGFLIFEYGFNKFRVLQRALDFEKAYGQDLKNLDEAWRAFLESVPVDLDTRLSARERFDADLWPGYTECTCPKVGDAVPTARSRARNFWNARDYRGAYGAYTALYEQEDNPRWGYQAALSLHKAGEDTPALVLIEELLGEPDLDPGAQRRLLKLKIGCLIAQREWPAAYAAMDARNALETDPSYEWQVTEECLRDPHLRGSVADALAQQDTRDKQHLFERLAEEHAGHEALGALSAIWTCRTLGNGWGMTLSPSRQEQALALVEYVRATPESADDCARSLLRFAEQATQLAEFDLAQSICEALAAHTRKGSYRFRAERMLRRITFERDYYAQNQQ